MSIKILQFQKATAMCTCLVNIILACLSQYAVGGGLSTTASPSFCVAEEEGCHSNSVELDGASLMQINFHLHENASITPLSQDKERMSELLSQRRAPLTANRTNGTVSHKFDESLLKKGNTSESSRVLPGPVATGQRTPEFLIISCPDLGKIVYTEVRGGASTSGRTYSLAENLIEPRGIAVDNRARRLYIADAGAKEIYSYDVEITPGKSLYVGSRLTIVTNRSVDSVTLDTYGNLYFTVDATNEINFIGESVISAIILGDYDASSLETIAVKDAVADAAEKGIDLNSYMTSNSAYIYNIFSAANPNVSEPGGIGLLGYDVYWANKVNGTSAGTVVEGDVNPFLVVADGNASNFTAFPTTILDNSHDAAYGVAATSNYVFWSTNASEPSTGAIYVQQPGFGSAYEIVGGIAKPRGLVWDGDGTIYYADQILGTVSSFPSGELRTNAPVTFTVNVDSAYGVAILQA